MVKGGEKVLYKGYGLVNCVNLYFNIIEIFFDVGFIMKDFMDVVILKLEVLGKLFLEDLILKFLLGVLVDK